MEEKEVTIEELRELVKGYKGLRDRIKEAIPSDDIPTPPELMRMFSKIRDIVRDLL